MKSVTELSVSAEEQIVNLLDGYSADIKFDPFYFRWYYNLYKDGEMLYAGISLTPTSAGLLNISLVGLGIVDTGDKNVDYEPYVSLGNRLMLVETSEDAAE